VGHTRRSIVTTQTEAEIYDDCREALLTFIPHVLRSCEILEQVVEDLADLPEACQLAPKDWRRVVLTLDGVMGPHKRLRNHNVLDVLKAFTNLSQSTQKAARDLVFSRG
jgi:hypothetical protein